MKACNITTESMYAGMPILQGKGSPGCHTEILNAIHNQMNLALDKFGRTLFVRFDLHFPTPGIAPADNSFLSSFLDRLKKHLNRDCDIPYRFIWVREHNLAESINHHYHFVLLLSANTFRGYKMDRLKDHNLSLRGNELDTALTRLFRNIQYYWAITLGLPLDETGIVNYCNVDRHGNSQTNGITIYSESLTNFERCFHWSSYLAKSATKGNAPAGVREFGQSTRLK